MATDNEEPLSRASTATTQRITIRLDEITIKDELYCHRDKVTLEAESLKTLMDSLILEGLQVPVEIYRIEKGKFVLLKGHRRVSACRLLAEKNEPGFARKMEIEAIEVCNATPAELIVRSVLDNEVRLNLDRVGRIRLTKKMHDAGVSTERAARAMGMSTKTFDRDLLIARISWMFQHVIDNSIGATHAYVLLVEAEKAERIAEMRDDLDGWIAKKKQVIREKEKMRKARDGKDLSPGEKQVKKMLPNHLVTHWVELLREKRRFDEDAQWNFDAGIETETEKLKVSSINLDLSKAPLDRMAKVAAKLSLVAKQMGPYIKKAHAKESGEPTPTHDVESPYDLDYLRDLGLEDKADELEAQTRAANKPDGEESPQEPPQEREEQDLTEEVQLPSQEDEDVSEESAPSDEDTPNEDTPDEDIPGEDDAPPPPPPPAPPPPPVAPPAAVSSPAPSTRKPTSGKGANKK